MLKIDGTTANRDTYWLGLNGLCWIGLLTMTKPRRRWDFTSASESIAIQRIAIADALIVSLLLAAILAP
jgi:hypothetical protein